MDQTGHNYYAKLVKLQEQGKLPAGSLTEVDIAHDDWCATCKGGYCDCDPDITLRARSTEALRRSGQNHLGEETRPLAPPPSLAPIVGIRSLSSGKSQTIRSARQSAATAAERSCPVHIPLMRMTGLCGARERAFFK